MISKFYRFEIIVMDWTYHENDPNHFGIVLRIDREFCLNSDGTNSHGNFNKKKHIDETTVYRRAYEFLLILGLLIRDQ